MNCFLQAKSRFWISVLCIFNGGLVYGHHSTTGYYDRERFIEIEGTVSTVHWRNPHIKFSVEVMSDHGVSNEWEVELAALSIFRSRGMGEQFLQPGDEIKVQGNPAFNGTNEMGGSHILLPSGKEVVVSPTGSPHFTDPDKSIVLTPQYNAEQEQLAREQADGIFRVWSTVLNDPSFPMFKGNYPVTETAAKAQSEWNPLAAERFECWEKGMPYLMVTPHPFEFVQDGEDILMRFEEDDAVRRIHMSPAGMLRPEEFFHLGYSIGRWEGETLVVETSNVSADKFDDAGTPQSINAHFIERFELSEDEMRLDYRISISDTETFTQPFDLTRFWVWVPGRQVGEWKCET